jgi:hypothetical protein
MVQYLLTDNHKNELQGGLVINNMDLSSGAYGIGLVYNTNHALPKYLNLFNNVFFNMRSNFTPASTQFYEIYTYSQPWLGEESQVIGTMFVDLLFLALVLFAYSLLPSFCSAHLIQEREVGIKQLLLISGAGKFEYWMANLLWDVIVSMPVLLLTVVICYIGDSGNFGGNNFGATFLTLLAYILDSTLLTYLLSMLWMKHVKAQSTIQMLVISDFATVVIFMLYFGIGALFLAGVFLAPLIVLGSDNIAILIISCALSLLCPQFAMARALIVIINFLQFREGVSTGNCVGYLQWLTSIVGEYARGTKSDQHGIFDFTMLGIPLLAMVFHIILFFIVLYLVEYTPEIKGFFKRLTRPGKTKVFHYN